MRVKPHVVIIRLEHQGNAFRVNVAEPGVGRQGNNSKRGDNIAFEIREFIKPCKGYRTVNGMDVVTLLMPFLSSPFVEPTGRNNGTLGMKPFFPEWAGPQASRASIECTVFWGWTIATTVGFGFDE